MPDEILDIVDGHDRIIGSLNRKNYAAFLAQQTGFIRAAELFIINDAGKIWIPVRTANKRIAPSGYDYSAAGHVESGEDYIQAIIRETKEEIALNITADDIELVAKLKSVSIRYIRCIYLLRSNQTPKFNPHDFVSAEWLRPEELIKRIDDGHPAKLNLRATTVTLMTYLKGV